MKALQFTLLFFCLLAFIKCSFAQDIIYTKEGNEIISKVIEIGISEIKYKDYDNLDGPIKVLRKENVIRIKYENGKEEVILPDKYRVNQESAILHKTQVVKFEMFSPLTGNITFGYERMLKVGTNLEFKIGIIGPGVGISQDINNSGAFLKAGPKFLLGQEFIIDGMRYTHPLKGTYIKPEVIFAYFIQRDVYYSTYSNKIYTPGTTDVTIASLAANLVFGKQWILGNVMTVDMYFGVGYGIFSIDSPKDKAAKDGNFYIPYQYGHSTVDETLPLSFSGGLTIGVIF